MSTAARPLRSPIAEAGSPDALNTALLSACLSIRKQQAAKISSPAAVFRLLHAADALSPLPTHVQRRFKSWLPALSAEDLRSIASLAELYHDSTQELFNVLGTCLFTEESAKSKGAIFTPFWLAQRIVRTALKNWRRLNAGIKPSLAADLSSGPGVFLSELATELTDTRIIGVDNCAEYVSLAR
ncbi:MAG TPA: class I SAM-dependent methyltransferase, partial [Terriglobales bacterium]|nr:class I SAM-dependent methyltransferase [Terriglobales bacterium]